MGGFGIAGAQLTAGPTIIPPQIPNFLRNILYWTVDNFSPAAYGVFGASGFTATNASAQTNTTQKQFGGFYLIQNNTTYSTRFDDGSNSLFIDSSPTFINWFQITTLDTSGNAVMFVPHGVLDESVNPWALMDTAYPYVSSAKSYGFLYKPAQTNWQYFYGGNVFDSGIAVDTKIHQFKTIANFSTNSLSFFIDGVLIKQVSGALPASGTGVTPGAGGGTAGASAGNGVARHYRMYYEYSS